MPNTQKGELFMKQKKILAALSMLSSFALWTLAICCIDVQDIGPNSTSVGFATINRFMHNLTGINMPMYYITDWLSLVPIAFVLTFAGMGLAQWIRRRSLRNVDFTLLLLGGYYIIVMAVYLIFEIHIINYRPVLIEGVLEASYPSSTTMLVLCVMPTTAMQLKERIKCASIRRCINFTITVFSLLMLIGRLISGVHWFTDIIGGCMLSCGLVLLYDAFSMQEEA